MGPRAREGIIMSALQWADRIDEVNEYIAIAEHPEALA
jgi:hypothetical protein